MPEKRRSPANRIARIVALAIAPVLVAAGVVLPASSASAVTYVACGDISGVSGLVNSIDHGNRTLGSTATVYLTPGCTYSVTEPAWDYDIYGNRIYEDSAFYELNDDLGYHTTLIVEGGGATIQRSSSAGALFRLFDIGPQGTVILKDLTLANSYGPHGSGPSRDGTSAANGGAIYNEGHLTLENVTFTGNHPGNGENGDGTAGSDGYVGGSGGSGGAIANRGTLTISGSTFRNNKTGDGGAGGGAAWNGGQGGQSGDGGAIWNYGTLNVTTSTFDGNYTGSAGSGGSGGFGSPPSYRGNGGAIASSGGTVTITRSLFLNNSTGGFAGEGGALGMRSSNLSVLTSTFVNNVANRAGAIYMSSGAATVRQSTFTGNNANGTGNRITGDVAAMDYGATMSFANTLMYSNDPSQVDCNLQYIGGGVTYSSLGGVMSDENSGCGTNTVVADPKLEALGNWGGPTQSRALKSDSPAIGAGTAAYCGGVDQRGVPRPASGCDIGAVERLAALTPGVISGPTLVTQSVAKTYSTTTTLDGSTLAYLWSVTGMAATISSTTVAAPQITFTGSGAATVNLNVRVTGASDAESINLTLVVKVPPANNTAPQLTWTGAAVTSANEGDTTRFFFTVAEPEGDSMSFSSSYPSCGTGGSLSASLLTTTSGYVDCFFPNGPTSPVVTVRIEDFWTAATSITTTVNVAEVAPTITVTGSAAANEGATSTYSYSIHEVGSDTFTPVTTCPGATKVAGSDTYTSTGHNSSGTFQCKFGNGPSTATATVTANGGTGSTSVSVVNVAPTISVSGPTPSAENGSTVTTYRYELNTVDPGDKANLTVVAGTASCGGTGVGVVVGYDASAVVCRFANGPSSAVVTATVRDQDGATSSGGGLTVQINNVVPTVVVGQPSGPVAEGGTVFYSLSATDPGLDTLTVTAPSGCTANFVDNSTPGRLTGVIACTYTDGPAVVSKVVQVNDGTSFGTGTIANQPVVDVEPTVAMNFTGWDGWEGGSVTLHIGAISDPGVDTPTSVKVFWGDGTSVTLAWPLVTSDLTHSYPAEGEYFATIDVVDGDGTHYDRGGSQRMVIHNSPPSVFLTAPSNVMEGVATPVTFSVTVAPTETWTIDEVYCGRDDTYTVIPVTNLVLEAGGGSFSCAWPVGERDQQITLGVRDSGGIWSGATANVRVSNAAPVVVWTSGTSVAYESGDTVHHFGFTASDNGALGMILQTYSLYGGVGLMYGCGQGGEVVSQVDNHYGGTEPGVFFDRTTGLGYIECKFREGPATAHVQVAIGDYQSQTVIGIDVTVLNAPPSVTVTGPTDPVAEGAPAVFSFEMSDPVGESVVADPADCGPHGTLDSQDAGTFTCIYDDGPADYTATLTVSDGADSDTDGALVHVIDVPPTSMTLGGSGSYEPGDPYELILGDTNDPGDETVAAYTIHWGDGSTSSVTSATPNPTHTYVGHDPHTITVDVTDEDGTYLELGTKNLLEVDHVAPVLTLPDDVTMEGNAADGLYWVWPRSAIDERDGDLPVYCTGMQYYDVYDFFFVNTTAEYDCWAIDAAGNRTDGHFSVTTVDTTAPQFDQVNLGDVNATSAAGAVVSWPTTAGDVVDYFRIQGTCDQVSGALYAFGTYSVHCEATDRAGNTGIRDFSFRVGDYGGPAISATGIVLVEATGPDGAIATYTQPTAVDSLDGDLPVSCTPASGSLFPLDYTTVTCEATDSASHTSSTSFYVRVQDSTLPVVTPTADILVGPTSLDGAFVTFDTPSVTDIADIDLTVSCYPASGSQFPIGVTTVVCATQDDWGNVGFDAFDITVQDTGAPTVTAPDDIVVEATGPSGEVVVYSGESAFDVDDGDLPATCDYPSGSVFPVGVTTVTCTATDSVTLVGTAIFTVSITDTTDPVVTTAGDLTVEATGPTTAATFGSASATDLVDGTVTTTCAPASGDPFSLGDTTVTCSATDGHGNTGTATFTLTVVDTTEPVVSEPNHYVGATTPSGAIVTFTPTAVDLVDGTTIPSCDVASGALFAAESTTTVTCEATDAHGNTGSGSFTVTVHGAVITTNAQAGDVEVEVSLPIFAPGDYVVIGEGTPDEEIRFVEDLGSIILAAPLAHAHSAGTVVSVVTPADVTAPAITAAALGSVGRGTTVDPHVVCTDAGVGVQACIVPALSTAALGAHSVTVRSWDFNGNLSTLALTYTVVSPAALGRTGVDGGTESTSLALMLLFGGIALVFVSRRRRRLEWAGYVE